MTLLAPMAMATVAAPASAAPNTYAGPGGGRQCEASDSRDVTVNSATNTVAVTDDPITAGNNFGCYTNLSVAAGDTITFQHDAVCGGGVPRVLVGFKDGHYENTFDTGSCTSPTAGGLGSASYTLARSGKIRVFAFINDRGDSGTVTYSNLVIDGNVINF
jgi:hypothetical protein